VRLIKGCEPRTKFDPFSKQWVKYPDNVSHPPQSRHIWRAKLGPGR
jgi:hypothetical protein